MSRYWIRNDLRVKFGLGKIVMLLDCRSGWGYLVDDIFKYWYREREKP